MDPVKNLFSLLLCLVIAGGCMPKSKRFRFILIVKPEFRGEILVNRKEDFQWNADTVYELDGTDGTIDFPPGAYDGTSSVVEVKDSKGKVLSQELKHDSESVGIVATVKKEGRMYFRIGRLEP